MNPLPKQALNDIRVLDFTLMLAGPYATMMFGDYGAEIIKIEQPGTGDNTRNIGPHSPRDKDQRAGGFFLSISRNKKSLTLNLKHPKGVAIVKELVKNSHVVIENFRPGVMDRLGLGYETLSAINPGIVYTSISGFGHTGPYRERPAFDLIAQAMGGVMAMTGPKGGPPHKVGPGIGDIWTSTIAAYATMVALHEANKTGQGQHVDCAMYDTMLYMIERAIMMYSISGIISGRDGNAHPLYAPYDCFETKDGKYIVIAGHWEKHWENFCQAMKQGHLLEKPELKSMSGRAENYHYLRPIIDTWVKTINRDALVELLIEHDVPVAPVQTVDDIFKCPQAKAREMIVDVHHPIAGMHKIVGPPAKMSKTPGDISTAAPLLGEHTEEVLRNLLAYSDEDIDHLKEEGVI
jgi:crotonobetainyl-CoA:carnitine CoA-transferase CaiB-like acyl-CoA transferase